MAILGYARVSTQDQDLTGQLGALKTAGATTVYREKVSGVKFGPQAQAERLPACRGH
jgi:DNA invertase Pin-like site-specific DNA recombinase